jgi:hypothetical protein
MPLNRTYTIFIITLSSAIMAMLVFFFIFRIIKNKNEHSSNVLTTIQSKIDQKDNIALLEKAVNDTKEKEALISSYLVHANLVDEFINFLEREGDLVSVPVEVVSVNAPVSTPNHLVVELKGTGTFEHVVRLISLIENAPYQIKINHAYINKAIDSSNSQDEKENIIKKQTGLFQINLSFDVISTE